MTFLFMLCHWQQHQHPPMPMAPSVITLHLFSQDNQNEEQCDFFGHVMHLVLALASHDAEGIVIICHAFTRSRQSK